jgi:hypothetical protein
VPPQAVEAGLAAALRLGPEDAGESAARNRSEAGVP